MDWVVVMTKNYCCSSWIVAYRGRSADNAMNIANLLNKFSYEDSDIQVHHVSESYTNEEMIKFLSHSMEIWWHRSEEYPGVSQTKGKPKRRA